MRLDFSRPVALIEDEKKTELISFRAGGRFKEDLTAVARAKNVPLAELILEYSIKGFMEDYKQLLLLQSSGDKTVGQLLGKL